MAKGTSANTLPSEHPLLKELVSYLHTSSPILCHLNADTTWLLLIPYPEDVRPADGRKFLKLITDPWFTGEQVDFFSWFSSQTHAIKSSVQRMDELEDVLRELEKMEKSDRTDKEQLAGTANGEKVDRQLQAELQGAALSSTIIDRQSPIDVVAISHEFTDHCHKETLTQLPASLPIIAGPAAAKLIRSWNHFDPSRVHSVRPFTSCVPDNPLTSPSKRASFSGSKQGSASSDWRLASYPHVPNWLSISQLVPPRESFHTGLLISFRSSNATTPTACTDDAPAVSAVIYTPHGLNLPTVLPLRTASPRISPLALLHGADKLELAGGLMQLNLGAREGVKVARETGVEYWIGTHEEEKVARGIVSYLLRREKAGVREVVEEEVRNSGRKGRVVSRDEKREEGDVRFLELGVGEAMVLERS